MCGINCSIISDEVSKTNRDGKNIKQKQVYFFLALKTTQRIITIKRPTRKKAHHIPALKIVSIAPQLLNTSVINESRNNKLRFFMRIIYSCDFNYCTIMRVESCLM